MKPTKFNEKFESCEENVFIGEAKLTESFAHDVCAYESRLEPSWFSRHEDILRQALLYFPGTFLLYHVSAGLPYLSLTHFRMLGSFFIWF